MKLSYTLIGRDAKTGKNIRGNVIINDKVDITNGLGYSILAFQIFCDDKMFCGCDDKAGYIKFMLGPDPNTIVATSGMWCIGEWNNGLDGTGAWFRHADGSFYDNGVGFGKLDHYKNLPPRIQLCADMVMQGPFQPVGDIFLTWDPQLYLDDQELLIEPVSLPNPPANLIIK